MLIIAAALAVLGILGFQKSTGKVDPAVKEIADEYVISLVGKTEFNKNYVFDFDKSEECKDDNQVGGCYIRYKFIPAEKYGDTEYLFFYNFSNNQVAIANNGVSVILPSCEKDKNNCNFKVSFEELKEIARQENLDDGIELIMYNDEIVAEISYCNLETTENRKKMYVSLQDGSILWSGPNSECQGII